MNITVWQVSGPSTGAAGLIRPAICSMRLLWQRIPGWWRSIPPVCSPSKSFTICSSPWPGSSSIRKLRKNGLAPLPRSKRSWCPTTLRTRSTMKEFTSSWPMIMPLWMTTTTASRWFQASLSWSGRKNCRSIWWTQTISRIPSPSRMPGSTMTRPVPARYISRPFRMMGIPSHTIC